MQSGYVEFLDRGTGITLGAPAGALLGFFLFRPCHLRSSYSVRLRTRRLSLREREAAESGLQLLIQMELLRQRRQSTPSVTQGPEREDHLMRPITTRAEELPGRVDRTGSERPRGCYVARDRFFDGDGLRQDVLFACDDLLPLRTEREPQLDDLNSGLEQRQNLKVDIHEWRSLLVAAWIPARPVLGIQRKVLRLLQCRYVLETVLPLLVPPHAPAPHAPPPAQ